MWIWKKRDYFDSILKLNAHSLLIWNWAKKYYHQTFLSKLLQVPSSLIIAASLSTSKKIGPTCWAQYLKKDQWTIRKKCSEMNTLWDNWKNKHLKWCKNVSAIKLGPIRKTLPGNAFSARSILQSMIERKKTTARNVESTTATNVHKNDDYLLGATPNFCILLKMLNRIYSRENVFHHSLFSQSHY